MNKKWIGRNKFGRKPEFGALVAFLTIGVGFSLAAKGFFSLATLASVLTVVAELGIVTLGISILMITGEFDLSVGSNLAISSIVAGRLLQQGLIDIIAIPIALLFGTSLGIINGLIVVKTNIPSFIATLGTMMFWRGIILALTGGHPTIPYFGHSLIFQILNSRTILDFRTSAFWFVGLCLIAHGVISRTAYGNWVYAIGGNREIAYTLGLPVNKVRLFNFAFCGMMAALAGLMQLARFQSVDALRGQGLELEAIAASVIGGVSLRGGLGSVYGAILGVLIVGLVRTGLLMAKAPPYWYQAFVGLILIIAMIVNRRIQASQQ
ncbi:MAG: ABC transporter permease [Candidatus Aminicenantes bacterium]|nr:ABC transporter permease [Candidatus Aminicenantes bacterium]